ncbi:MAG: hypothetical protein HWE15_05645 [Algoriphagus sp.]|uniref:hypothetical protein n=1 Tax=Algoriphagus sp. TaxID=1872435 RepID=UPI001795BFB7|nr:hypothetical protein [Algoriphagus sp.]NVJ85769.1 hypothetical protein [Algoriphagus sp.]
MSKKVQRVLARSWLVFWLLFLGSCEQPLDPIIQSVTSTNTLLQSYSWQLEEFTILVDDEDIPPPILFSLTDSLMRVGRYDLDDMIFDASDMRDYTVLFTDSRDLITSEGPIDVLGDSVARYFVFNERSIRIISNELSLNYRYLYDDNQRKLSLTLTSEQAGNLIQKTNQKLIDAISNKSPDKLGDLVAKILFNNESIQRLINDLVVSALAGKLEFVNDFDPKESADILSKRIVEELKSIDWEGKLTELIRQELEKITNIDPDVVAGEIASEITAIINQLLSTDKIYDLVLPFLDDLATDPDGSANKISTLVVDLLLGVFNEENLQPIIASAWQKFTELDDKQVEVVADTLTSIVEKVWINEENITQLILPITQKIDETSLLQMGKLAAEAVNSIEALVGKINTTFPDLNLEPDYESMEGQIRAIFIAAKPVIGLVGGPEKAAQQVAALIKTQFLSTDTLTQVFTSAINALQNLDPQLVGEKIAAWLTNLAEIISPDIIEYLSDLLSPILDNLDPEFTAFKIAQALNGFIKENVTQENIKTLILPAIEFVSNINAELVARYIAQTILSLDIIEDNINEETIAAILLPVLESISEINPEQLSQAIVNALVNSGIFEDVITEDRLSAIIALVLYNNLWNDVKVANNFKEVTITLRHE